MADIRGWEYQDVEGNWHLCRDEDHKNYIERENRELAGSNTNFRPLFAISEEIATAIEFLTWWKSRGKNLDDAIEPVQVILESIKES